MELFWVKSDTYPVISGWKINVSAFLFSNDSKIKVILTLHPIVCSWRFMVFLGWAKHLSEQIINVNSIPSVMQLEVVTDAGERIED